MTFLLIVFTVLFVLCLRWGVVGIHGGGVERSEQPPLYWLTMIMFGGMLVMLAYLHFTGR